jgi:hypothetical protein
MRERTSLGRDALLAAALLLGGLALPACIHQPKWYESDQEVNGSWAVVARKTPARPARGPTCGHCGQAVKPDDKECSHCGAPLGQ